MTTIYPTVTYLLRRTAGRSYHRQQRVLRAQAARALGTFIIAPTVTGHSAGSKISEKIARDPIAYPCPELRLKDVAKLHDSGEPGRRARQAARRALAEAVDRAAGELIRG